MSTFTRDAALILDEMADTYRQRNAIYGENFRIVPKLVCALFPEGVPPDMVWRAEWHLFELMLVKLSRFAVSGLTHIDSIHDAAVYAAMVEACLHEAQSSKEPQQ